MVSNNSDRNFHRVNTLIFQETQRKEIRLPRNQSENRKNLYCDSLRGKEEDILKFSVLKYTDAGESA